jgi:hypothetical protein
MKLLSVLLVVGFGLVLADPGPAPVPDPAPAPNPAPDPAPDRYGGRHRGDRDDGHGYRRHSSRSGEASDWHRRRGYDRRSREEVEVIKVGEKHSRERSREVEVIKVEVDESRERRRGDSHEKHHDKFPPGAYGRGELDLSDWDIELLYTWLRDGKLFWVFNFVEQKLYNSLSRPRQRQLHAVAGLFRQDEDFELFELLKHQKYRAVYRFLAHKFLSKPDKSEGEARDSLWQLNRGLKALFGREHAKKPSEHNHFFEVQNAIISIIVILW